MVALADRQDINLWQTPAPSSEPSEADDSSSELSESPEDNADTIDKGGDGESDL